MAQDVIIKGADNLVVFVFSFDISGYTEITLSLGGESYSTVDNPLALYVDGTTDLVLDIGDTTILDDGYYLPEINADGTLLNGDCKNILGVKVRVC